MKFIISILAICTGIPAFAHQPADGQVYASLGALTYRTDTAGVAPMFVAPGLTAEADVDDHGGLEISMFYLRNSYTVRERGHELTESMKRMYISTGYRHWFSRDFSAALAFASSYSMGNRKAVHDDFGALRRPNTSAHDVTEYGLDFSLQYEPWRAGRFACVFDLRYALDLTAKHNEDANTVGMYVALKYFVQAREKISPAEE